MDILMVKIEMIFGSPYHFEKHLIFLVGFHYKESYPYQPMCLQLMSKSTNFVINYNFDNPSWHHGKNNL
jgi:hypothetical protein